MGKVSLSDSFVLLMAIAFLLDGEGIVPWFLLASGVHEIGHIFAILTLGGRIDQFRLTCAGGLLRYHLHNETARQRAMIAGAGPLAGLLLTAVAMMLPHPILAGASLLLSLFNLLPISPLDGATVVQAILPSARGQQMLGMLALFGLWVAGAVVAYQAHGFGVLFIAGLLTLPSKNRL